MNTTISKTSVGENGIVLPVNGRNIDLSKMSEKNVKKVLMQALFENHKEFITSMEVDKECKIKAKIIDREIAKTKAGIEKDENKKRRTDAKKNMARLSVEKNHLYKMIKMFGVDVEKEIKNLTAISE
ncbi:MAG TPA: hypothetical protein PK559_07435 [Ignavibacteriaceae bacterium]|nr:hypothetical protein [Ignavibacteriaceae bacterium]